LNARMKRKIDKTVVRGEVLIRSGILIGGRYTGKHTRMTEEADFSRAKS
jgi:hypothetical protein